MLEEVADRPKVFNGGSELSEAVSHALSGRQALCLYRSGVNGHSKNIGYLFDQDTARLSKLAGELGVKDASIGYAGERLQHVCLHGLPLARALAKAAGF